MCYFNVNCVDRKICENDFIFFYKILFMVYLKRIKIINVDRCKRWLIWGNMIYGKVSYFLFIEWVLMLLVIEIF